MITEATQDIQYEGRLKEDSLFDLAKYKLRGEELFQGQYWHKIKWG